MMTVFDAERPTRVFITRIFLRILTDPVGASENIRRLTPEHPVR